ncbi:MAG TPA: sodium:proton antiporter [Phycisphaerae bacterium]|nr:sodium:proton antiporter [Phycisphaerae bacterium]
MKSWLNLCPRFEINWCYPSAPNNSSPTNIKPRWHILLVALLISAAVFLAHWILTDLQSGSSPSKVELYWCSPFVVLLLALAVLPVVVPHVWHRHYIMICGGIGFLAALGYSFGLNGLKDEAESLALYLPFITLLSALFVIASGIQVAVNHPASPVSNVMMLLLGAILANVLGTTGISILLIRPFLEMNMKRLQPFHIVFFVFIVSNIGGVLTPMGDPPLLAGFLFGMPFWWMLRHAWAPWLLAISLLLLVFYLMDRRIPSSKASSGVNSVANCIKLTGLGQLFFICLVLAGLFLSSPWSEIVMIMAAGISLSLTPAMVHGNNHFTFYPLREMAILFLGIFLTMAPVLNILSHASEEGKLDNALKTPGRCYILAGGLSAFLDNTPTYLACLQSRAVQGQSNQTDSNLTGEKKTKILQNLAANPVEGLYTLAISLGAVFFGAATWIGNGPNLLIKSIAEESGIACPSFVAYILKYTIPILLPVLVLVWLVFLL